MGWKKGFYYDRRGRYIGNGDLGRLAETFDKEERELAQRGRDQARERDQAERREFLQDRQQAARVDSIVSLGLIAAGFWRPYRHGWRRKTMATQIQTRAVETATLELAKLAEFAFIRAVSNKSETTHDALAAKLEAPRRAGWRQCKPGASPCC